MSPRRLFACTLSSLLFLAPAIAAALGPADSARSAAMAKKHPGMASSYKQPGKATPFGSLNAARQTGKRPEELAPPTQSECALKEQTGRLQAGRTRQDAAGRVHIFNEGALKERRSEISAGCSLSTGPGYRPLVKGSKKPASAWDKRSNTLKAAREGYVDRSASMAMKPQKPASLYNPATGGIRPPKALSAYGIYQQP